MAEARFVLKEPNSSTPTLVYLLLHFNRQKLKYSSGRKIEPKYWNQEKQLARESKAFPEHADLNAYLDIPHHSLPLISVDSLPLISVQSLPVGNKLEDLFQCKVYQW